ncbi:MAG: HesA/MoeB/ThiF family protein [Candidatus Binataceae bacterium]
MANERVLIVGVGGLGVPAATALARAGMRNFGLIDADSIDLSNLPRQVIYSVADIGAHKVSAAARRLAETYPGLALETHHCELDSANAVQIITGFDFVIDATDSPVAKFLINDTCVALKRPFIYAGLLGWTGQAMTVIPGRTACLRCLFEEPPDEAEIASCREAGIIGPVAGAIGEIEAAEAIRVIGGGRPALAGAILTYDGAGTARIRLTPVAARAGCGCGAAAGISADQPAPHSR